MYFCVSTLTGIGAKLTAARAARHSNCTNQPPRDVKGSFSKRALRLGLETRLKIFYAVEEKRGVRIRVNFRPRKRLATASAAGEGETEGPPEK